MEFFSYIYAGVCVCFYVLYSHNIMLYPHTLKIFVDYTCGSSVDVCEKVYVVLCYYKKLVWWNAVRQDLVWIVFELRGDQT